MTSFVEQARRINRTWLVQGTLAEDAARYLDSLQDSHSEIAERVSALALQAARAASREHRDPKPDFYASLFSLATRAERDLYLKDHLWTRLLSLNINSTEPGAAKKYQVRNLLDSSNEPRGS